MTIGNCSDVTKYQDMAHIDSRVLMAFMHGHIITIGGEDYRFARKDQELYSEGDNVFVATETGVFKRMLKFGTAPKNFSKEHANGFIWTSIWGDSMAAMLSLISEMTQDEKIIAVSNLAFDIVANKRSAA